MEQSTSPPKLDPEHPGNSSSGRNGDLSIESKDSANQRMIADRLMAALASGNLDHLAQAREAFLKQPPPAKKRERASEPATQAKDRAPVPTRAAETRKEIARDKPEDLEALLERRTTPRTSDHLFAPVDELRKEEEELNRVEEEL
ncbi:MAG: hypothetical protein ACXW3C_07040, partial [Pyrinomonadaceae bacterium]